MTEIIASAYPTLGPAAEDRLAAERWVRAQVRRIFEAVIADRWDAVRVLYAEAELAGDWYAVGVWAGLPNTVKDRIREMNHDFRSTG